ncbi:hypothetical protein ABZX12_26275 [Kribbella sp. NPDC003505]|uniref:hypothetical protein n=1 Tax=Kribbella sp. NPDC003505 TaxID=3154448 RepID=UPI0033BC4B32
MEYEVPDSARRKVVRGWWPEVIDPAELNVPVARRRVQPAEFMDDLDRAWVTRYLKTLDDLVAEAREPEGETVRRAEDVLH